MRTTFLLKSALYLGVLTTLLLALPGQTEAADAKKAPAAPTASDETDATGAEKVNVDKIKEKYWARGDESELGVVQNRLYSKDHKFEFGLFGGWVTTDPFLSVNNVGASFGYHFSEYFSAHFFGFKDYVGPSSALTFFQQKEGATVNTNEPRYFAGTELSASIIYGKLSFLGQAIIYYDLHLLGGAGVTLTESGNDFTPFVGIGQQIFLTQSISLRMDYRLMRYEETILEKVIPTLIGTPQGYRVNYTNSFTLGLSFMFGGLK